MRRAQQRAQEEADRILEDMLRATDGTSKEGTDVDLCKEPATIGRTHSEPT